VLVNGRRMNIPSYKVAQGDVISIRQESRTSPLFTNRTETLADIKSPAWMTLGDNGFALTVGTEPTVGETEAPFDASVIIQFYSR